MVNMKLISSLAIATIALTVGTPVAASYEVTPYIGMDAKWYHMPFKKGFGDNLTEKNYPQANPFFGIKVNDFFGVEAGYAASASKTRNTIIHEGDSYFGQIIPAATPSFTTTTQTKINGFNVNLVGFLPLWEEYALDLIGAVGLAHLKLRITHDDVNDANSHREFSKEKWIPRVNIGLQHMIAKQFGIRATVGWEKTSKLGDLSPVNTTSVLRAKVKDSTSLGFGLFYNFK